ncbi:MAG: ABC transporter permease [Blastocatellia bacterium]|nr:ABC transporter permease [Blastocatellia bacterium]
MTKLAAIAMNTFRESVRDRVLYNLVLFVLLLVLASIVMGRMAAGQEAKIVVDVGLSAMTLFGVLISIFLGVGLVSREIEKRTIANLLSKPIRRSTFLVGKYAGLCLTLLVNTSVMALAITLALAWVGGGFEFGHLRVWPASWLIFLQLSFLTAVALLFSSFSSPALSALFTLLLFLIGRWSPDLKLFAETAESALARGVCRALYGLLPNLANFNRIDEAAHGGAVPAAALAWNTVYAAGYIAALVAGAALIFERRNFK